LIFASVRAGFTFGGAVNCQTRRGGRGRRLVAARARAAAQSSEKRGCGAAHLTGRNDQSLFDGEAEGRHEDDRDRLRSDLLHAERDQPAQEQEVQPERDRRHDQESGLPW
jgi:hypothetical protein